MNLEFDIFDLYKVQQRININNAYSLALQVLELDQIEFIWK